MTETRRLSLRAYARRRRTSPSTVHAAIVAGRITRDPDGLIDPERADREWLENTDSAMQRENSKDAPGRANASEPDSEAMFTPWDALADVSVHLDLKSALDRVTPKLVGKSRTQIRELLSDAIFDAWERLEGKWRRWYGEPGE